jgi:hypothetical protein
MRATTFGICCAHHKRFCNGAFEAATVAMAPVLCFSGGMWDRIQASHGAKECYTLIRLHAYTPNVAWLSVRKEKNRVIRDGVDLDGAGTSAATPQVAAAAALWLQYHRNEFTKQQWESWEKPEAVYYALLKSAERDPKKNWPDRYLGSGLLKASEALDINYAQIRHIRRTPRLEEPQVGSLYFETTPNEHHDGFNVSKFIFGSGGRRIDTTDRAKLQQRGFPGETRTQALQRLYYNMFLVRDWTRGSIPMRGTQEYRHWTQAGRKSSAASRLAQGNSH